MKIVQLECWTQHIPLSVSYTIAYETVSSCTNVFLKIITDTKLVGYGCAAPDFYVTNEDAASVIKSFRNFIEPMLGYCLRKLEMELQPGSGMGHGLVGVFEIRK